MKNYKPILAATVTDLKTVKLPCLASHKLDGIRCALIESPRTEKRLAATRTLKPVPNEHVRKTLEDSSLPLNLDGELIVGDTFQTTVSGIMSYEGEPAFSYHVFDYFKWPLDSFQSRYEDLKYLVSNTAYSWLKLVPHVLIETHDQLEAYEEQAIADGYEGIMIRSLDGRYKFGRSTFREGILLKVKRFLDSEAIVLGFVELMHNDNVGTRNNLGQLERSTYLGNLTPANTLGALKVRDSHTGIEFEVGTGFTAMQRKQIWNNQDFYKHKILTYKYQPYGMKDKPRAPVFLRWRNDL